MGAYLEQTKNIKLIVQSNQNLAAEAGGEGKGDMRTPEHLVVQGPSGLTQYNVKICWPISSVRKYIL